MRLSHDAALAAIKARNGNLPDKHVKKDVATFIEWVESGACAEWSEGLLDHHKLIDAVPG